MTKISRLHIYLSVITFFKSIFIRKNNYQFIDSLKKLLGYNYVFPTSMCRVGFLIILEYLKINNPNKNEIIIFSYNLKEMIDIPRILGFKIILIDINMEGFVNLEILKEKISVKTSAILMTNMFNNYNDSLKLKSIANKNKILLIEDNAIYFGNYCIDKNKKIFAGSFGDVSIGSFGIMKNICSLYGGYIATNNENISLYIKQRIENFNSFPKFIYLKQVIIFLLFKILTNKIIYNYFFFYFLKFGHKYKIKFILKLAYPAEHFKKKKDIPKFYYSKMPYLTKNILNEVFKTDKYNTSSEKRKNKIEQYSHSLGNIKDIKILNISDPYFQNFLEFPIVVKNKEKLAEYLFDNGIETKSFYYKNCEELILNKTEYKNVNSSYFEENLL